GTGVGKEAGERLQRLSDACVVECETERALQVVVHARAVGSANRAVRSEVINCAERVSRRPIVAAKTCEAVVTARHRTGNAEDIADGPGVDRAGKLPVRVFDLRPGSDGEGRRRLPGN